MRLATLIGLHHLRELRPFVPASVKDLGATWIECTAFWNRIQSRHGAINLIQALTVYFHVWNGGHQANRIRMFRMVNDLMHGPNFHNAARIHDGHAVGGGTCRHGTGNALQTAGIARRQMRIGREHGERVRGGHETAMPDDEIAVAISVGRRAEIRRVRRHHQIVERFGVDQIGVGVMPAEILQRHAVAHRAGGRARDLRVQGVAPCCC